MAMIEKIETVDDAIELLETFCCSLALSDHMGDVLADINVIMKRLGHRVVWHSMDDFLDYCGKNGITTYWGDSVAEDE